MIIYRMLYLKPLYQLFQNSKCVISNQSMPCTLSLVKLKYFYFPSFANNSTKHKERFRPTELIMNINCNINSSAILNQFSGTHLPI